jgi:urease subunit gamma/beta
VVALEVNNTGDRPVQVGSHFHFFEVNRALRFDRAAAWGLRLAVAPGAKVVFAPGRPRTVRLVPIAGARIVRGHGGLVDGPLDAPGAREAALALARERGYRGA